MTPNEIINLKYPIEQIELDFSEPEKLNNMPDSIIEAIVISVNRCDLIIDIGDITDEEKEKNLEDIEKKIIKTLETRDISLENFHNNIGKYYIKYILIKRSLGEKDSDSILYLDKLISSKSKIFKRTDALSRLLKRYSENLVS